MTGTLTFRLTLQFAALVTLTTAVVLAAGGWLLRHQAVRSLELMHRVEGTELGELIGKDADLTADEIERRIKHDADSDSALYFIQVHNEKGTVLFRSANLDETIMPDLSKGASHWTARLPEIGNVRVSEFFAGPWRIQIGSALSPVDRLLASYAQVCGLLIFGTALVGVGLGYGFSRLTLGPVRVIEQTARRIRADNLRERIPVPAGRDELSALAQLLNQMFDRLESSFEQVKRFTADASHELKTPLALIRLNAERLRPRVAHDPEGSAALSDLLEEVGRMNRIIESLLFIAKVENGMLDLAKSPQVVSAWLAPFVEDARALAEDRGTVFVLERNDLGEMRFEPNLMRQLLLNLVGNALAVSPPGGRIALESVRTEHGWWFTVTDEGPGLPPDQLENVFGRFVRYEHATVENHRRGHGLGLAICRGIAELHGGTIHAENRPDRSGLRVIVQLRDRT